MKLSKIKPQRKKGFWLDIPYIIIMVFVMIILIVIVHKAYSEMSPEISSSVNNTRTTEALDVGQNVIEGFDILIIMVMIGLAIALIASVFLLETHPMFFVLILFMLIAMVGVGLILSEVFETLSTESDLEDSFDSYPLSSYVLTNFGKFILFYIFIGIISFYGKSRIG
jgi:ABC-type phosphate transport system permease subunit